jgi:hypothetical protein
VDRLGSGPGPPAGRGVAAHAGAEGDPPFFARATS